MAMPTYRRYNVIPDKYDHRDLMAATPSPVHVATFAPQLDLRVTNPGWHPPIWNQGSLGSCTAHGTLRVVEIERRKQALAPLDPSRLAEYYFSRDLEGDPQQDGGAQVRDAVKAAAQTGVAQEGLWPYAILKYSQKPPVDVYADAATRKVGAYHKLDGSPEGFMAALASGYAVTFGFFVYPSFESAAMAASGIMPMPANGEAQLGGHCVAAVGYRGYQPAAAKRGCLPFLGSSTVPSQGYLICANSWGSDWGQQGYFLMPFDFVRQYTFDPWVVDGVGA
jgi:C1A family cysteine protease